VPHLRADEAGRMVARCNSVDAGETSIKPEWDISSDFVGREGAGTWNSGTQEPLRNRRLTAIRQSSIALGDIS
jgi:hypothetical protein